MCDYYTLGGLSLEIHRDMVGFRTRSLPLAFFSSSTEEGGSRSQDCDMESHGCPRSKTACVFVGAFFFRTGFFLWLCVSPYIEWHSHKH